MTEQNRNLQQNQESQAPATTGRRRLSGAEVRGKLRKVEGDKSYIDALTNKFKSRVFGQDKAALALARRVAISEAGLSEKNKPLGVFFFLGPTGTGKTEMAHALSEGLFGNPDSDRLKIVPMEEYQDAFSRSRLLGAPPGYVGYEDDPFISHDWLNAGGKSVIVFDELEKGHPDIVKTLLGVLNDATLNATSDEGTKPLDFSNSYIIFTSNAGAEKMQDASTPEEIEEIGLDSLKAFFPPEFRGRINDTVVFMPLAQENMVKIIDKFLKKRTDEWKERKPLEAPENLEITEELENHLLEHADRSIGGRGVKNILDTEVFTTAAAELAGLRLADTQVIADYDEGKVVFLIPEGDALEEQSVSSLFQERNRTDFMSERAKEVLGQDFLGVEAIRRMEAKLKEIGVDVAFDLNNIPEIPYTQKDIEAARAGEEMLVLRAKNMTVNGEEKPVTITEFEKLFTQDPLAKGKNIFLSTQKTGGKLFSRSQQTNGNDWYKDQAFATEGEEIELEWALVKKYPLLGTEGKSWDEQERILNKDYKYYLRGKGAKHATAKRRTAMRAIWDSMLYYVNTGERLLEDAFDWTSTQDPRENDNAHVFAGFVYERFGIGSCKSEDFDKVNKEFPKGVYPER